MLSVRNRWLFPVPIRISGNFLPWRLVSFWWFHSLYTWNSVRGHKLCALFHTCLGAWDNSTPPSLHVINKNWSPVGLSLTLSQSVRYVSIFLVSCNRVPPWSAFHIITWLVVCSYPFKGGQGTCSTGLIIFLQSVKISIVQTASGTLT